MTFHPATSVLIFKFALPAVFSVGCCQIFLGNQILILLGIYIYIYMVKVICLSVVTYMAVTEYYSRTYWECEPGLSKYEAASASRSKCAPAAGLKSDRIQYWLCDVPRNPGSRLAPVNAQQENSRKCLIVPLGSSYLPEINLCLHVICIVHNITLRANDKTRVGIRTNLSFTDKCLILPFLFLKILFIAVY